MGRVGDILTEEFTKWGIENSSEEFTRRPDQAKILGISDAYYRKVVGRENTPVKLAVKIASALWEVGSSPYTSLVKNLTDNTYTPEPMTPQKTAPYSSAWETLYTEATTRLHKVYESGSNIERAKILNGLEQLVESIPPKEEIKKTPRSLKAQQLSHIIKERLAHLGRNQSWLAGEMGVSRESTSNYVSGEIVPEKENLARLLTVLEVPYEAIAGLI